MNLARELTKAHASQVDQFLKSLAEVVLRKIERIVILALHGESHEVKTVRDAIQFIDSYDDTGGVGKPIERYEIQVRYNNGIVIEGKFKDKASAIEFLQSYQVVSPRIE
jgi:hypothetical protein